MEPRWLRRGGDYYERENIMREACRAYFAGTIGHKEYREVLNGQRHDYAWMFAGVARHLRKLRMQRQPGERYLAYLTRRLLGKEARRNRAP